MSISSSLNAGVAGLAAIGAAQSLGAIVHAFDVRPEVAEQIESMGAQFVYLDFAEAQDGAATGGYAAPSSPEFREKQLEKFRELAPEMDIVITTALIPGRPAPKLWLADMVAAMKPGSATKACRISRPSSVRTGMFWRFGSLLLRRPVAATA